jgi:hypothetical protein
MSRQLMGDGGGVLAVVNGGVTGSAVVVVSHPLYANATKFLKKDMVIDIYNGATKQADSVTILSVDSTTQITLTAPVTVATRPPSGRHYGLRSAGLANDGLDGIARATDPRSQRHAGLRRQRPRDDTSTRTERTGYSETLLETCFDNVEGYWPASPGHQWSAGLYSFPTSSFPIRRFACARSGHCSL